MSPAEPVLDRLLRPIMPFAGLALSALFVLIGFLMVFRPQQFMTFHDTFIDRSAWSKVQSWRARVADREFKFVGVLFVAVGAFMMWQTLRIITGES